MIEAWLAERPDVSAVTATMGQGFFPLRADLHARKTLPWAETRVQQIIYGPAVGADVEARFSGPDPDVLRGLADEALAVLHAAPLLQSQRIDWRERNFTMRPIYAEDRGQSLGVTRADVASALALATDGIPAGSLREGERDIPIVVRTPLEWPEASRLIDQLVYAPAVGTYIPLGQVIDGLAVQARDGAILRRDRVPTICVQGFITPGVLADQAFRAVRAEIEAMRLPPSYSFAWGGEFESAGEAQASLGRQMPLAFGTMLLITLLLFGKLRQKAVIWTILQMAVKGATVGLLATNLPFSFTALLGLLSLSGMLIKNAIVLVEEIDAQKDESGLPQPQAIVTASVSRLRPVVLAAGTTILGMVPLLFDVFLASMAVTIMAGLGFASILTLIGVPVLYHTYLRRERRAEGGAQHTTAT